MTITYGNGPTGKIQKGSVDLDELSTGVVASLVPEGTFDAPLILNANYLWVDGTGDLRISATAPTTDTDGVVVGTQA